ncbi:unnamed protein product [Fraxinus pennsylvanica]|uniref:Uncharacterized protein n=1 Tax=Fraxinus pennsylvanica TaxID=56036 RepID=A0AAD2E0S0_9LAMI|nr:unnamed protein product [Fraxinus pennsylvanica]
MPANNRVHSSAALQTHGIWQSAIGYDPYAPNKDDKKNDVAHNSTAAASDPEQENAYASFQGLLALARITGSNADEDDGDKEGKDPDAIHAAVLSGLEKLKGKSATKNEGSSEDEDEESESSDSDYNSEIERAIAEKYGRRVTGSKLKASKSRKKKDDYDDSDESELDSGSRKKRGRSKKRRSGKRDRSDSEDEDQGRRKVKKEKRRRRNDESSDEEEERRRRRRKIARMVLEWAGTRSGLRRRTENIAMKRTSFWRRNQKTGPVIVDGTVFVKCENCSMLLYFFSLFSLFLRKQNDSFAWRRRMWLLLLWKCNGLLPFYLCYSCVSAELIYFVIWFMEKPLPIQLQNADATGSPPGSFSSLQPSLVDSSCSSTTSSPSDSKICNLGFDIWVPKAISEQRFLAQCPRNIKLLMYCSKGIMFSRQNGYCYLHAAMEKKKI